MFEVSVEHTFAAGHALRNYRGKCENVHGHNYRVQVLVRGEKLDQTGMLADFVELKRLLRAISEPLDHVFLNDIEPFNELNPSAENMAWYICQKMREGLRQENPAEVVEVRVWETDIQYAAYRPADTMLVQREPLSRTMELSARNQLPGTVQQVDLGDIMARVVVKVGDHVVESVITRQSAEDLGLKQGDMVRVVVKSTEVMIQKD